MLVIAKVRLYHRLIMTINPDSPGAFESLQQPGSLLTVMQWFEQNPRAALRVY
jgi:hypothetical protein